MNLHSFALLAAAWLRRKVAKKLKVEKQSGSSFAELPARFCREQAVRGAKRAADSKSKLRRMGACNAHSRQRGRPARCGRTGLL